MGAIYDFYATGAPQIEGGEKKLISEGGPFEGAQRSEDQEKKATKVASGV
jgi:hypothetical protein